MNTNASDWSLAVVSWLVTYAMHACLWTALAWALARYLRSPALRERVWKAAVIGALLTASVHGAVGANERALTWALGSPIVAAASTAPGAGDSVSALAAERTAKFRGALATPVRAAWRPEGVRAWTTAMTSLWIVGAVVGVAHLLISRRRWLRSIGRSDGTAGSSLRTTLARLVHRADVRRPTHLTFGTRLASPVALVGGEICVPTRTLADLTEDERDAILAHELAHIDRRDPEWLLALALAARVFFFVPVLRLTALRIESNAELLCDDRASEWTGGGVALARGLQTVAGWSLLESGLPLGSGAALVRSRSALIRRVERMLDRPDDAPGACRRLLFGLSLAGFALGMACAGPGVQEASPDEAGDESGEMKAADPPLLRDVPVIAARLDPPSAITSETTVVRVSIVETGERVDAGTLDAWDGEGAFTFEGRRIRYSFGNSSFETGSGIVSATNVDFVAGFGAGVEKLLDEWTPVPTTTAAVVIVGPGVIYSEVAPVVDALRAVGCERIKIESPSASADDC